MFPPQTSDVRDATPTAPASATQTQTSSPTAQGPTSPVVSRIPAGTLRLRGGPIQDRRVRWGADVVDNEGMGKKKSKGTLALVFLCCIYHRPRPIDESSSDDSSSSSSDDDSDDSGHGHTHGKGCDHGGRRPVGGSSRKGAKRSSSPNAYEKMPKPSRKKPAK
ncbi:Type 1 phosphatases regulator ypi1 [Rhizina undulata]